MDKSENLQWFTELMKSKMMKHEEDPTDMTIPELLKWLDDEVAELKWAIDYEFVSDMMLECADIANLAFFIADKLKKGKAIRGLGND